MVLKWMKVTVLEMNMSELEKFPVAVHLITESSDHYNKLLHVYDLNDLIDQLEDEHDGEMRCVSRCYISTGDCNRDQEFRHGFRVYLDNIMEVDPF